jgi:ankyrin repeat protein
MFYYYAYSAAQRGDLEVVQLLLFNSANPDIEEENGFIALHVACANGHRKVVEFLIKAGSDPNHASKGNITPIQLADQNGHSEIVEMLAKLGGRVDGGYAGGDTWGAYFKDTLGKAWTQSIRILALTMPEDSDEHDKEYTKARPKPPPPRKRPNRVTKGIERI